MPICRGLRPRTWSKRRSVDDEDAALDLTLASGNLPEPARSALVGKRNSWDITANDINF
jgi:hypothetical protein